MKLEANTSPYHDHDYFVVSDSGRMNALPQPAKKQKVSYIDADVPPQGYGFVIEAAQGNIGNEDNSKEHIKVELLMDDDQVLERRLNVNVTGSEGTGMRTVVLHVPKDIQ